MNEDELMMKEKKTLEILIGWKRKKRKKMMVTICDSIHESRKEKRMARILVKKFTFLSK